MGNLTVDTEIWKKLAIEKQVLLAAVTEAFGIDPEASREQIREEILRGLNNIKDAETLMAVQREEHASAMGALEEELNAERKKVSEAQQEVEALRAEKEKLQETMELTRMSTKAELQNLKAQLETKTRDLKNVNTVLGDSPANAAKKIKALNKKKHDDNEARKRLDVELKNVRKELRSVKAELEEKTAKLEELEAAAAETEAETDPETETKTAAA